MPEQTDLALELADLCDSLHVQSNVPGDEFLANHFEVPVWSPEFFQTIFSITNRTAALERLIAESGANPVVVEGARRHLGVVRSAFDKVALARNWKDAGVARVAPAHSSPIRMLSGAIARDHSYPKLSEEEAAEMRSIVHELLKWLREHQLSERDFIRQNLIDGLEQFIFRLERLQWYGWGYSFESLKEVITAYFALERGTTKQSNPDAAAALKKVAAVLKKVFNVVSTSKDVAETGDWALTFYKSVVMIGSSGGSGFIAGLLTG